MVGLLGRDGSAGSDDASGAAAVAVLRNSRKAHLVDAGRADSHGAGRATVRNSSGVDRISIVVLSLLTNDLLSQFERAKAMLLLALADTDPRLRDMMARSKVTVRACVESQASGEYTGNS